MDILHVSALEPKLSHLAGGTLISIEYGHIQQYIDNEDAYFSIRLPHKSIDKVFCSYKYAEGFGNKVREMITTPIRSEKYGYSIRVNETRKLPYEITRKGAFHRQKLRKAVVTVSMNENYEINDANCYQIRRLEEDLYRDFVPEGFCCDDVISYQWKDSVRGGWLHGQFNFYLNISHSSISIASLIAYLCLLYFINSTSGLLTSLYQYLISLL